MIVVLHGEPGDAEIRQLYEIPAFENVIQVRCLAYLGLAGARALGFDAISMFGPNGPGPTDHELEYKFQWVLDGEYHFGFTGKIDGV